MALQELGTPYTPVYYPGVVQLDQAELVVVRAGDEVQADLTLRKIKTVTISGKVIGSDALRHVMVSLTVPETGNEELTAQAERDGSFRITNVPAGTYILGARNWDRDKSEQVRQKLEVGDQNIDSLVLAFGRGVTDRWPNPLNFWATARFRPAPNFANGSGRRPGVQLERGKERRHVSIH